MSAALIIMFRWLLIGLFVFGMGTGLQRGWVTIDGCRFMRDMRIPTLNDLSPDATPVCPSDEQRQAS
jgi:hypothetical protein